MFNYIKHFCSAYSACTLVRKGRAPNLGFWCQVLRSKWVWLLSLDRGAGTLSWEDLDEAAAFVHPRGLLFSPQPHKGPTPLLTWAEPRVLAVLVAQIRGQGSEVTCSFMLSLKSGGVSFLTDRGPPQSG